MRKLISIFAAFLIWLPASAQELHPLNSGPEGIGWPTNGWAYGKIPAETNALVQPLIDKAMAAEKAGPMGETRAIVIVHKGEIVAEAYRNGFTKDTKHISWSVAKSFTNALVGRAVHLGVIEDIDDLMPTPFPAGDPRGEISWRHWLNMTEGLSNHELSEGPLHKNYIADMMFGAGKYDVAAYAVDNLEVEDTPGEVWKYSTGGYHLIGWALAEVTENIYEAGIVELSSLTDDARLSEDRKGWEFLARENLDGEPNEVSPGQKAILDERYSHAAKLAGEERLSFLSRTAERGQIFGSITEIGIDVQPEFDAAGTYLGGSNVWASAHDYAKFGYLYLRDGVWEGERLLPEGWVDFSRTKTTGANANVYGAGFWITAYGEEPSLPQAPRSGPWDAFNANGSEGQTIWIVPSRDLVIVRLGQMENNIENWNLLFEWCQEIARAFPEVTFEEAAPAGEATAELVAAE